MCSWRHLALLFLLLSCLSRWPRTSAAASDTLSTGESLAGNRTLVSAGGKFELGFFSPAGGGSDYYAGVWYKRIPGRTVIWVLNRDSPVADPASAELTVARDGNLLLLLTGNGPQRAIWSSNSTGSRDGDDGDAAVAVLLDTGNLVLRGRRGGNSSAVVWQSFDHPTDTLVPSGWMGLNKRTGAYQALRSWRSAADPSTGLYTDRVDPHGSGQYAYLWNGTAVYHYVGAWNGRYFAPIPEMGMSAKYTFVFVNRSEEVSYSFRVNDPSTVSRLVMSPHGQLTMFDWSDESGQWLLHWATPTSLCDEYSACGPFGLCDVASSQYCRCLPGFEPASPGDWAAQLWSAGCARKTTLQCSGNASSTDGFIPVQNVQLPSGYSPVADAAGSSGDCASACLRNCSCTAYAYRDGCLVWGGDLRNAQQLADGDAGASTLFLRVAAADLATASHGVATNGRVGVAILGASCVIALAILCLLFVLAWVRRREETVHRDGSLLVFSHGYLARCTKNYSHSWGRAASAPCRSLPDHTAIAVKRLEGSAQGEKQFRAELRTLGTIQHVNLVRLRGFCATGHERLLVYDYMPNGSLASVLSESGHSSRPLDWRARFGIMAGVARGLAYLHERYQERIVHCDVKPENILLDAGLRPKVADFGVAKLIARDNSRALTTARGTVGYLAPEWILGLPITAKADLYSYGMVLLELVSGRRNRDAAEAGRRGGGGCYFPLWAATKVREGQVLVLLDERLTGDADVEELGRACNVACWCIQQDEALRPTMGQVVQVLEGSLRPGTAPVPRYLEQLCVEDSCTF